MDERERRLCSPRRGLMIEAVVAAGPRKATMEYVEGDTELCEDCAGYRAIGDVTIFWICDGTSNSHELPSLWGSPGFNSRVLAQDLGERFGQVVAEALVKGAEPDAGLHIKIFEDVAGDWQERLISYLSRLEREGKLVQLLNKMPRMGDGLYGMKWSSAFLGGIYNQQEMTLDIVNVGDSVAVVLADQAGYVGASDCCVILIASISGPEPLKVEVCPVAVEVDWLHFNAVQRFVAVSDGVAKDSGAFIEEMEGSMCGLEAYDLRRRLLMSGALTYDDKAVIIGQIMEK